MTPKKSVGLQLRVVMCLIILVGVRVTNVFVPIYSKKIVDALTEKIFAWQLILAFVGLKLLQGEFIFDELHRYTYRLLQSIQIKAIFLCFFAEQAVLDSAKTALKFKYEI